MRNDYSLKIENLKRRRYDEALKRPALSEAFHSSSYSDCIKYAFESMLEIDPSYAYKVYAITRKIQDRIAKELRKRGYHVDYRYQGELKTYSNIILYGDAEIIVLKKNITRKPHKEVQRLAFELMDILKGHPNVKSLEYSDKTRIRITAFKPVCEINILPSVWVDSLEYKKTKNEIYRGIAEFDFKNKKVKKYLPFLNIARINAKDHLVNGNLNSISRLLKTLRADSERSIGLIDSEINAIVYSMNLKDLKANEKHQLGLLPRILARLDDIYVNEAKFDGLLSPSGKDRIFIENPSKKAAISNLHASLEALINDLKLDLETMSLTIDSEIPYS